MKNILITGGLGFVGKELAVKLNKNYNVIIIDKKKINRKLKNIKIFHFDFSSEKSINIIKKYNIDTIIHLAAYTNVIESEKHKSRYKINNYLKSKKFFKKIKNIKKIKQFLFASSAAVYGDNKNNVTEKSICKPTNYYGKTKLLFENYLLNQKTKVKIIITRFFNIISEEKQNNLTKSFFNNLARSIQDKKTFYVNGNNFNTPDGYCYRDFIDIKILTNFVIKLLKNKDNKLVINIGTGKSTSIGEIVKKLKRKYKKKFNYQISQPKYGEIEYSCANVKKLKQYLNLKEIKKTNFMKCIDNRLKN